MLGINSNINSLVAQQNLTGSGSALSQAITRLSSGKRINSAADDAAGLAISNIMQTQINGLNQGVSNSNDGVSLVQTASSGLSSLTSSLQRIRQLATQAANGSMTSDDRAALQQEVNQQVSEINRIASQTTYNGMNVLNGSLGNVSFQVGANVGQTISLSLNQNMSAASIGSGVPQAGQTLGTFTGLSLTSAGATAAASA
ncbi:MAG TPA: flagellin, partial [Paraburkholderia sp.]